MAAFDHTHGFPVGFICNRHALITAMFGSLALDQYCRGAAGTLPSARWLGPLLYACSLLSGEAGTSVQIYILAYALFVEDGTVSKRLRSVAPYLLVTLVLARHVHRNGLRRARVRALHRSGRGARELLPRPPRTGASPASRRALRSPVRFLRSRKSARCEGHAGLRGALRRGTRRSALASAEARSNCPVLDGGNAALGRSASTTHPNNRLLFFCSIGAMGVVAQLWDLYAIEWRNVAVTGLRWFSRAVAALLMFMHLVISPLALPVVACSLLLTTPIKRAFADVGPDVKGRDAVFITAPDYYSVKLMPMAKRVAGEPLPRRWRVLSFGPQDIVVHRTDAQTLVVDYDGGILGNPLMELYRDRRIPMAPGDTVTLEGLSIRVLEVTPDARAKTVQFSFDTPLDSPSFSFFYWAKNRFLPFTPPPVGGTALVPAARVELGL